jgi:hypothetical protein
MTSCWLTGDPIANIKLLEDPGKNLVVIMKDGKVSLVMRLSILVFRYLRRRAKNVRLWHIADIDEDDVHVRFWGDIPDTSHQCPLMTPTGREVLGVLFDRHTQLSAATNGRQALATCAIKVADDQNIHLRSQIAGDGVPGRFDDGLAEVEARVENDGHACELGNAGENARVRDDAG